MTVAGRDYAGFGERVKNGVREVRMILLSILM